MKTSPSSNHSNKSCGVKVENSNNSETPTSSPTCINITNNTFYTNNIVNVNVKCGSSDKCNGQTDLSCGYFENELLKKEETVVKDIMDGCFNNDGKCYQTLINFLMPICTDISLDNTLLGFT